MEIVLLGAAAGARSAAGRPGLAGNKAKSFPGLGVENESVVPAIKSKIVNVLGRINSCHSMGSKEAEKF